MNRLYIYKTELEYKIVTGSKVLKVE